MSVPSLTNPSVIALVRCGRLAWQRGLRAEQLQSVLHVRTYTNNGSTTSHGKKRSEGIRPSLLYQTVMGRGPAKDQTIRRPRHPPTTATSIESYASPAELDTTYRVRLDDCAKNADVPGAAAALADISADCAQPTVHAIKLAIDAAVAAGDAQQADKFLALIPSSAKTHDFVKRRVYQDTARHARTKVALAYAQIGAFNEALRVMRLSSLSELALSNNDSDELANATIAAVSDSQVDLGQSAGAWGVVVRSLSKLGLPRAAVSVADTALRNGVGMTDGLLQVTMDALRMAGRWRHAAWLFDTSLEKGLSPSERTISSVLRALTCRDARRVVDVHQVERVAGLAESSSPILLTNCFVALSTVGSVSQAEVLFTKLAACSSGVPSQFCFSTRMACYSNFLDRLDIGAVDEVQRENIYKEINAKADDCWHDYLRAYCLTEEAGGQINKADGDTEQDTMPWVKGGSSADGSLLLKNYLRTKVQCFKCEDALVILEDIVNRQRLFPYVHIGSTHVATVLGAVELCSDVDMLERIIRVMQSCGVDHDMRSIAFKVGTLIGDGDIVRALRVVREEGHSVVSEAESAAFTSRKPSITNGSGNASTNNRTKMQALLKSGAYREYFPTLLLRRLSSLAAAFDDVGIGRVPDLDALILRLRNWPCTNWHTSDEGFHVLDKSST